MRKIVILMMVVLVLSVTLGAAGFCEMQTRHDTCGPGGGVSGECVHGPVCCALAPFAQMTIRQELPAYIGIAAFALMLSLTLVSYINFNSDTCFYIPIDPPYKPPKLTYG